MFLQVKQQDTRAEIGVGTSQFYSDILLPNVPVGRVITVTDSDIFMIPNSDLDSGDRTGPKRFGF